MARKRKSRRSPGEGSIWERSDTGRYQAAVVVGYTPTGNPRRVRKSFDTKTEASEWIAEQQAALKSGVRLDSRATVQELFDEWIANGEKLAGWAPNTKNSYRYILTKHVLAKVGHVRVRDLSPGDVKKLLRDLVDGGYSLTLVKRVRSYLSILMLEAQRSRIIDRNPVADVKVPAAPEPTLQRWSEEEVAAIVRACLERDDQAARYTLIALGTGLRTEELLGLTWADVDLEQRLLTVRRVAPPGGAKELRDGGKTDAAARVVAIDEFTAAALRRQAEHVEELVRRRVALNEKRAAKGKAPLPWADLDLVFCTSVGSILDRKTLRAGFDAVQEQAKVTRIRLYATRSTHGSLLADAGVNLHALAERLGHTDPRFTAKVYLQGSGSAHRAVADQLGRMLEAASRGSPEAGDPQNHSRGEGSGTASGGSAGTIRRAEEASTGN